MRTSRGGKGARILRTLIIFCTATAALLPAGGKPGTARAQGTTLPLLKVSLSAEGTTLQNGVQPLIVVADPNPPALGQERGLTPQMQSTPADPSLATASFQISYIPAGGQDPWNQVCTTFPAQARTAFEAAAAIWANIIKSSVPITIRACWANLGSSSILGYSGGEASYRDFTGAPRPGTWYESALANALAGSDLDPAAYDDYITYNTNFNWYYGTDGNPPAGSYDLVTVAAHEIAHGLNFAGMASYSGGSGSFGWGGYPNIYDTFMEDVGGTRMITYANPSAALGNLLRSGSLWFDGIYANSANSGRVGIYAPGSWSAGSSYAHLDYNPFRGTQNRMMVYAISSGDAQHDPGAVAKGLLKDLGWRLAGDDVITSWTYLPLILHKNQALTNGDFESGSTGWTEYSSGGYQVIYLASEAGITAHSGTMVAWLGGVSDDTSAVEQQVQISSSFHYLTFWQWIASEAVCGSDFGSVWVNGTMVEQYDLCQGTSTSGWVPHSLELGAYDNQVVTLRIQAVTGATTGSSLFVDDVSLEASPLPEGMPGANAGDAGVQISPKKH